MSLNKIKRCELVYTTAKNVTVRYFFRILSDLLKDNFKEFKKVLVYHIKVSIEAK